MKTYVKIALGVVTLFSLAGILAALYMFNMKYTDMSKAKPDFVISASALQKAFEDDEAAASKIYISKIIEVTGKIATVSPPNNNLISISLATGDDFSTVNCAIPATTDPETLNPGNEITIRGECSGFLMDVLLKNCILIQK